MKVNKGDSRVLGGFGVFVFFFLARFFRLASNRAAWLPVLRLLDEVEKCLPVAYK